MYIDCNIMLVLKLRVLMEPMVIIDCLSYRQFIIDTVMPATIVPVRVDLSPIWERWTNK